MTGAAVQGEQRQRLESKLKRELGDTVLSHLADDSTEDIALNPDSSLWVKRMGERFLRVGERSAEIGRKVKEVALVTGYRDGRVEFV